MQHKSITEETILEEALGLNSREAREAFLEKACAGDAALRSEIEGLIEAHEAAGAFMEQKAGARTLQMESLIETAGARIGRYRLVENLGEGGCGLVFLAEQELPIRREVALKVIKAGMDTRSVIARFEAERQTLAMMDHPNIAKVFDAGATDTGRPYFVMELVRGVRITEFCEQNRLSIPERLELFIQVCDAVQHAHQKGIIHRDLKPSNILIGSDGSPKIIDFGISKAMAGRGGDATIHTLFQQLIGTPAYMSPEQARMTSEDIDTRSDIYSLGVVLYELLTGKPPFDNHELLTAGLDEMRRIIGEVEPKRPSETQGRGHQGGSKISSDLDWIVMKCLEKDRGRRYQTAGELAADVERHLRDEPVTARPPTAAYKIHKFVRRNKTAVVAAAAVFIAIIGALVFSALAYRRERSARSGEVSERQRAERETLRARQFQYASDMNLAQQAAQEGNLFRALQLLDRHRPGENSGADLRGWEWMHLWEQCQSQELLTLGRHSNGVAAVGFLPRGEMAYSAGNDKSVRLWDLKSRQQVSQLLHPDNVNGVACSLDGRWLATSVEYSTGAVVRLWEMPSQRSMDLASNAWIRPNSIAFSPDGNLLAFAEVVDGIQVWSLEPRQLIARLPVYNRWLGPMGIAFSPDGQTLAHMENEKGDIALWDVLSRSVTGRLKGHSWYVTALAFTPDGQTLVSGSADRSVRAWNLPSRSETSAFTNYTVAPGAMHISSVRLSPKGTMIAAAASGAGLRITVQNLQGGQEVKRLQGHTHLVTDVAFSPDERLLISGSLDGSVRLWDLASAPKKSDSRPIPEGIDDFPGSNGAAHALSSDGRRFLTIFTNRTFTIWAIPALTQSAPFPLPAGRPASAAVGPEGEIAFVAPDGNITFWRDGKTNWFGKTQADRMSMAQFSENGKRLAVCGPLSLSVFEVATGKAEVTIAIPGDAHGLLHSYAFSPDGQTVMAGFSSGLSRVWNLNKPPTEWTVSAHDFQVNGLVLHPDGRTLVSASRDIRFWAYGSQTPDLILNPRPVVFRCPAISRDGRRLAIGASDGLINIYDLASKQEVATLTGHSRHIVALAFLPDDQALVSVGVDEIRVWRAASSQKADRASGLLK